MSANNLLSVVTLKAIAAASSFVVPAGHRLDSIDLFNNTANAITGGLKFGTTNGGNDVITAQAVAGSANLPIADANILKRFFSKTADQTIFFDAVVSWNSANVDVYIVLIRVA